ncbi:NAD(P)-binding protein [Nocardia yamanashiensis]|uniref:NAD(P)-binding protein n=1 Tax=Nocardia yamanashiensis TaxID=209247 RepID=UPI000833DDD1|nr:NAD(P)-binding protein [Nocardia yamanashiensis]
MVTPTTIIGGGIAGTALGAALAHRQYPVTVYERQPAPAGGAFLVLDTQAQRSLAALGVSPQALDAVSHPIPGGFKFHYRPAGSDTGPSQGQRLYPRAGLMHALTDFARAAHTDIRYGHTVTDIDRRTGTLFGPDGALNSGGLVIAADGIDSLARTTLDPRRSPTYAGQVVIYGTTARPVTLPDPDVMHFHGQLGEGPLPVTTFGHLQTPEAVYWFARLTRNPIPMDDIGFHPAGLWMDALLAADPTAEDLIATIVEATDTIHVSNTREVSMHNLLRPVAPVILIGDADHAISPAWVRGAREAIEDAVALTKALTEGTDPAEAMAQRRITIAVEREMQQRRANAGAAAPPKPEPARPPVDPETGMDWETRMWGFE